MKTIRKDIQETVATEEDGALSRSILVADDDEDIQSLVADALEFMGFTVATVGNCIEALSVFVANAFDLVLTDFQMPGMDGLSLASRIKARSPGTPVILLTGSDSEAVRGRLKQSGVDSVIYKPFRIEELKTTILSALDFRER